MQVQEVVQIKYCPEPSQQMELWSQPLIQLFSILSEWVQWLALCDFAIGEVIYIKILLLWRSVAQELSGNIIYSLFRQAVAKALCRWATMAAEESRTARRFTEHSSECGLPIWALLQVECDTVALVIKLIAQVKHVDIPWLSVAVVRLLC